ncbi:MAG TPA: M48 family metalloprotease [Iamia sp.]
MDDALARNLATARRLALTSVLPLAVVLALLLGVLGMLLAGPIGAVFLVAIVAVGAALAVVNLRRAAPVLAIAAAGAGPVSQADEPRLHNLVEGLCVGIGLTPPTLWLVDDPAANALAAAQTVDAAHLVVTRGLLTRLSLVELEAVLAHELARIRRGEAVVGALALPVLGGGPALRGLSQIGGARFALWMPLLAAPISRAIVGRGEPVESWSDLAAVDITRYPPGLTAALEKLAADPTPVQAASPAVSHLWIHGATAEGPAGAALRRVYEPAPSVGRRIEVLEEL